MQLLSRRSRSGVAPTSRTLAPPRSPALDRQSSNILPARAQADAGLDAGQPVAAVEVVDPLRHAALMIGPASEVALQDEAEAVDVERAGHGEQQRGARRAGSQERLARGARRRAVVERERAAAITASTHRYQPIRYRPCERRDAALGRQRVEDERSRARPRPGPAARGSGAPAGCRAMCAAAAASAQPTRADQRRPGRAASGMVSSQPKPTQKLEESRKFGSLRRNIVAIVASTAATRSGAVRACFGSSSSWG